MESSREPVDDSVIPPQKYLPLREGKTFWDEGQYDAVAKRLENGKRSLNDFLYMVEERSAIERRYADKLQSWYNKWSTAVRQGPEYGDVENVWQSVLNEGKHIADIHFKMSSNLGLSQTEGIQKSVYMFKKSHFHKLPLIKELKEVKECRETFKAIQAPYKKAVENIMKLKKKYLEASKNCTQASNKDSVNASKIEQLNDTKEKARAKYTEALAASNDGVFEKYSKEMTSEFQRYQDFELERLKVLLNSLHDYIGVVNQQTHSTQPLSAVYNQAMAPLNTVNPEKNTQQFSQRFGIAMPQNFPRFEEAGREQAQTQQRAALARGPLRLFDLKSGSPLLTRLKHLRSDGVGTSHHRSYTKDFLLRRPSHADSLSGSTREIEFRDFHLPMAKRSYDSSFIKGSLPRSTNESVDFKVNTMSKEHAQLSNVYVRATTDFSSSDPNHLEIKKGEVIYQIKGDVKGWCYGRIAYKEGLYPTTAVKLLTMNLFSL